MDTVNTFNKDHYVFFIDLPVKLGPPNVSSEKDLQNTYYYIIIY